MTNLILGKILGQTGRGIWVQTHDFVPEDPARQATKGRLIALVSWVRESDELSEEQTIESGRELLSRLHELYFSSSELDQAKCLKETLEQMRQDYAGAQIGALVILDAEVVVGSLGLQFWCRKENKVGFITQSNILDPIVLVTKKHEMTLAIGNTLFWETVSEGLLQGSLDNGIAEAADSLTAVIHGQNKLGAGALLLGFAQTKEVESPPIVSSFAKPKFVLPKLSKMQILGLGVFITILLAASIGAVRSYQVAKNTKLIDQQITLLQDDLNKIAALSTVDRKQSGDLLSVFEPKFIQARTVYKTDPRLTQMATQVEALKDVIKGVKTVTADFIADVATFRPDAKLNVIGVDTKLYLLDTLGKRIFSVDPSKQKIELTTGGLPDNLTLLATYPQKVIVGDGTDFHQVIDTDSSKKVASMPVGVSALDVGMYAGNIYALTGEQIYKFSVTDAGYGSAQPWLAQSVDKTALGQAKAMYVDGSIWVWTDSFVTKFTKGVKDDFVLNLTTSKIKHLVTAPESEKIYILTDTNKILSYSFSGDLEAEMNVTNVQTLDGLALAANEQTLYLVSDTMVYGVAL